MVSLSFVANALNHANIRLDLTLSGGPGVQPNYGSYRDQGAVPS